MSSIWKNIALILIGVVGTGCVSWATYVKTAVTREELKDELPGYIVQYSPYTEDAAALKQQLAQLQTQNAALQQEVLKLEVEVARISEHLGVGDTSRVR